ncbi:hypothetical protein GCM10010218_30470 [Streptomyces mashuensis]|uniref:HTH gntR-type domain-containing protein n=1 Tax=Streptomyces mashuensis TaxID=33904 RepID=A0A919B4W9_9ACTN|nr:winged helix-turn-helix domain-containing protein [Streptomyces mashuensis]GHF47083.1 hypothetical protein GCM10010218_30470 [Streptomyces mashuensis]
MADEQKAARVDPGKPEYLYLQVVDHIAGEIAKGSSELGTRLPGERDMAQQYGVAVLTIRRAMKELRRRGLVVTLPSRGIFIRQRGPEDGS